MVREEEEGEESLEEEEVVEGEVVEVDADSEGEEGAVDSDSLYRTRSNCTRSKKSQHNNIRLVDSTLPVQSGSNNCIPVRCT